MRVESSEEARHPREHFIFEHASKAKWSEKASKELVLVQQTTTHKRVSELLDSSGRWLDVLLKPHKEGRALEEAIEEPTDMGL